MTVREKMKTVNKKVEQNKTQYDFGRQTTKILALSSENLGKPKSLIHKDVLPDKDWLENAATIKRFEHTPLGSEGDWHWKNNIKV